MSLRSFPGVSSARATVIDSYTIENTLLKIHYSSGHHWSGTMEFTSCLALHIAPAYSHLQIEGHDARLLIRIDSLRRNVHAPRACGLNICI